MKGFIKLVLLVVIIMFALINYRVFTFQKGASKTSIENKNIIQVASTISSITKIEYYERTIPNDDYKYKVYIETNADAYLLEAKQEEIDALNGLGILSGSLKPQKISPIPFYFEIIAGILVIAIPFGKIERNK